MRTAVTFAIALADPFTGSPAHPRKVSPLEPPVASMVTAVPERYQGEDAVPPTAGQLPGVWMSTFASRYRSPTIDVESETHVP